MTMLERQSFVQLFDQDTGRTFEDLVFKRCYFEGCGLSITRTPSKRSTVRNVQLIGCEQRGSIIDGAIVDDVLVDGLKTNGLLQTWAAAFRHVTLRGKVGRVMFSDAVATGTATPAEQAAFDLDNASFYAKVDWALDLTEAEFDECDARGVPGHLVRRDPLTQALVTRDAAMQGAWRNIDLSGTYWPTALSFFLRSQRPDIVLVAPKRNKNFGRLLDGLKKLRDCGVAELD